MTEETSVVHTQGSDRAADLASVSCFFLVMFFALSLLMMTQEIFVDSADQDQTVQNVQSEL